MTILDGPMIFTFWAVFLKSNPLPHWDSILEADRPFLTWSNLSAVGEGFVEWTPLDDAGSDPWDSWRSAVGSQTQKPPWTKSSEIKKKRVPSALCPILESINAAVSLASKDVASCECLADKACQCMDNMLLQVCVYLSELSSKIKGLDILEHCQTHAWWVNILRFCGRLSATTSLPPRLRTFHSADFSFWRLLILYLILIPLSLESFCSFHQRNFMMISHESWTDENGVWALQ